MDGISQRLMLALQGMTPMFVGKDFHSQSKSLAKDLTTMMIQMARTEFPASSGAQTQAPPTQAEKVDELVHIVVDEDRKYCAVPKTYNTVEALEETIYSDINSSSLAPESSSSDSKSSIPDKFALDEDGDYVYSGQSVEVFHPDGLPELSTIRTLDNDLQDDHEQKLEALESIYNCVGKVFEKLYRAEGWNVSNVGQLYYGVYYYYSADVYGYHPGVDINRGEGEKLYSLVDGIVIARAGYSSISIYVPADNVTLTYMHFDPASCSLSLGDFVHKGDFIATESGIMAGKITKQIHTHLQVSEGACYFDLQGFIVSEQSQFHEKLKEYLKTEISRYNKLLPYLYLDRDMTKRNGGSKETVEQMQKKIDQMHGDIENLEELEKRNDVDKLLPPDFSDAKKEQLKNAMNGSLEDLRQLCETLGATDEQKAKLTGIYNGMTRIESGSAAYGTYEDMQSSVYPYDYFDKWTMM